MTDPNVIVPREPSEKTVERAVKFMLSVNLGGDYRWPDYFRDLYKIMVADRISAAPAVADRIGSHGPNCHTWGHRHYECALRHIEELEAALSTEPRTPRGNPAGDEGNSSALADSASEEPDGSFASDRQAEVDGGVGR